MAVSCGRQQIRVWVLHTHTHTHTHHNTSAPSLWGKDKQLYIFFITLPNETDNMNPCDALQEECLHVTIALDFSGLCQKKPDIQLLMCIDHITQLAVEEEGHKGRVTTLDSVP